MGEMLNSLFYKQLRALKCLSNHYIRQVMHFFLHNSESNIAFCTADSFGERMSFSNFFNSACFQKAEASSFCPPMDFFNSQSGEEYFRVTLVLLIRS